MRISDQTIIPVGENHQVRVDHYQLRKDAVDSSILFLGTFILSCGFFMAVMSPVKGRLFTWVH